MKILKGVMTHDNENGFHLDVTFNPLMTEISTEIVGQGSFIVTSSLPIFDNTQPTKWYIADSKGNKYAISQTGRYTVNVQTFDSAGEFEDNRLFGNLFEVEL